MPSPRSRVTGTTMETKMSENSTIESAKDHIQSAKTQIQDNAKSVHAAMEKPVAETLARSREQFEKTAASMNKSFTDMQSLARGNVEAMFALTAVVAKGCEEMSRAVFGFQQETAEQAMGAARQILAAKTLREVVDLQSQYSKSMFDGFMTEGSKISELGMKVANDAMAPIAERVNATVETLSKPIAA